MMLTLPSLVPLQVVVTKTTCSAASGDKVGTMTTLSFQCQTTEQAVQKQRWKKGQNEIPKQINGLVQDCIIFIAKYMGDSIVLL